MADINQIIDTLSPEELDLLNSDPHLLAAFKAKHGVGSSRDVAMAADDFPAGAEVPFEQRLAENAVKVGNSAGMAYALPGLAKGAAGLGLKGLGAISKGLAPAMEDAGNFFGSRVLNFSKGLLPKSATKAADMVGDATEYAMNPHPEVQNAIREMNATNVGKGAAADINDASTSLVPASERTVKDAASMVDEDHRVLSGAKALPSGTKELSAGASPLFGEGESTAKMVPYQKAGRNIPTGEAIELPGETAGNTVVGPHNPNAGGPALEGEIVGGKSAATAPDAMPTADALTGVDELGNPILSMANPTTSSQLAVTESHLGTVGKAIENTLKGLDDTGNLYDPKSTVEQLASMYQRNASGSIIPPGSGSQQALYNQAVNRAIETLKANAMTDRDVLQKMPWEQANAIKKALTDLAEYGLKDNDPVNMVYQNAARAVRDSIDDQASTILAAQGKDVSHFQTLRDSYSKLKMVQSALNGKALSAMGAKNVAPVVRTGLAVGALTTGHPLVAAGVGAEYIGREFGPIMAARAFKNASQMPAAASAAGANLTAASGGMSNAAKGVAAGLALDINEGN